MKNRNFYFLLTILIILTSCSDFGDINVNPNAPTFVKTETLLTSAQRSISNVIGAFLPVLWVQHLSEITYTGGSNYGGVQADFNEWYSGPLANLQEIINLNSDELTKNEVLVSGSNNNQIGVAMILQGYFYHILVDRWGPLPFSEALKGTEILLPAYNSEQEIYYGVFDLLDSALAMLDGGFVTGDIILGGDTKEWEKFANTLRAVMALRISDVDPSKAEVEFIDALNKGVFLKSGVIDK